MTSGLPASCSSCVVSAGRPRQQWLTILDMRRGLSTTHALTVTVFGFDESLFPQDLVKKKTIEKMAWFEYIMCCRAKQVRIYKGLPTSLVG